MWNTAVFNRRWKGSEAVSPCALAHASKSLRGFSFPTRCRNSSTCAKKGCRTATSAYSVAAASKASWEGFPLAACAKNCARLPIKSAGQFQTSFKQARRAGSFCTSNRKWKKLTAPRTASSAKKSSRPAITQGIPSRRRHFSTRSACRWVRYKTAMSEKLRGGASSARENPASLSSISMPPTMRLISLAI